MKTYTTINDFIQEADAVSRYGYRTLRYQDTSGSNHFGTSVLGPKCPDQFGISAEISPDTSAAVPKCRPVPTLRRSEATASPNFLVKNSFCYKKDAHFFSWKENTIFFNSYLLSTEKNIKRALQFAFLNTLIF